MARARRLEPGNASILNAYAVLNGIFGRRDAMISIYKEALASDPLSMSVLGNLAGSYIGTSQLDEMAELVERMRQIDAESEASKWALAWYEYGSGNVEAALDQFLALGGNFGTIGSAFAFYDLGRDAESDAAIQAVIATGDSPVLVAMAYAYRGEIETAFEFLEQAYEEHNDELVEIRMFRPLDVMHGDQRWAALLDRVGISDADAKRAGL